MPLQPPDAVQLVAFDEDQVNVALPPSATLPGVAARVTTGSGAAAATVTVVLAWDVPPAPVQLSVYVAVADKVPVDCEPLVSLVPVQPPDALQEVAPVVDQLRVVDPPVVTELGLATNVITGADGVETTTVADAEALPPDPVQLKVNVLVPASNVPVVSLPLTALVPVQDPEAEQLFAYEVSQVRVDDPGADRVLGFAARLTCSAFAAPAPPESDPPQEARKMTTPAMTHLVIDGA